MAERREWGKDFFEVSGPESFPNVVADTVFFVLGHRLGDAWNRTGKR